MSNNGEGAPHSDLHPLTKKHSTSSTAREGKTNLQICFMNQLH